MPGGQGGRLPQRITEQQRADSSRGPLKARKPGEYRDIPVPGYARDAAAGLGAAGYLFDCTHTRLNRAFAKAVKAAGLERFTPHSLRHVFASVCLANGVPITDVSRWLGHRNIQVTYGHLVPDSWDQARAVLDAEFDQWSHAA